jgi:hypothetical protein
MLKRELKVDAELVEGRLGEFTIWVDNKMVGKISIRRESAL